MPKYIIEHLEPKLFKWCVIEYKHISEIVGKYNLMFTNIKPILSNHNKLSNFGKVFEKSIEDLKFDNICVLDILAEKELISADKNNFNYFVFGGILGDNPPKKRALLLIQRLKKNNIKFETRNLGKVQMATDTAVYVSKKILEGRRLNEIKFVENPEIAIGDSLSVILPFRYASEKGKPFMGDKFVEYLRNRKGF